jgi:cytoplasmic iron level regulating protein YaaA (DUF328/UPF0246 family)
MLILLSPAKKLAETTPSLQNESTPLCFKKETLELVKTLKEYSAKDLATLMSLSEKLATLNYDRYQNFSLAKKSTLPALFIFQGDVYQTLKAEHFNQTELNYAEKHLRILSGLYGLLAPMNDIAPYRLEMGTSLATSKGKTLYDYWGEKIAEELNKELKSHPQKMIINLASNEYSKAVNKKALTHPIIDVAFKDYKNGAYKTIGILAKRARGTFANFMITNGLDKLEDLKAFKGNGYAFNKSMSDERVLTFVNKG